MNEQTPQYKPGDIANGHVLTEQGWVPVSPAAKKSKPIWTRWYMFVVYVVVGLITLGALVGEDTPEKAQATAPTATETVTETATPSPTEEAAPVEKTEPTKEATPTPAPKPKPAPEVMDVTAAQLVNQYDNNELSADLKFKGKTLRVTGRVDSIDTELFNDDKYILRLKGEGFWGVLTADCYDIPPAQMAHVKNGQTVTVLGQLDDGGDLGVILNNCSMA